MCLFADRRIFRSVSLRRTDLEAILGFLVDVSELEFDEPYPPEVVARLGDLVASDSVAYQVIDHRARRTDRLVDASGDVELDTAEEALYWTFGPCPIVDYRARTGDLAATRLSDLVSRHNFHELPVYRECFAPERVDHMIDVGLPAGPGKHRSFILFRLAGDGDFSGRDREMLEMLRPHFVRLEAEAARRRQLAEVLRARNRDLHSADHDRLTAREHEIVELVAEGRTNAQIAAELWVAPSTVKKHLEHVYEKLGVGGRTAAVTFVRSGR